VRDLKVAKQTPTTKNDRRRHGEYSDFKELAAGAPSQGRYVRRHYAPSNWRCCARIGVKHMVSIEINRKEL
jgi:hypothetical protein